MRLKTLLSAAAILAVAATPAAARDLTAVSFGGAYGAAQKEHMVDPYIAATGNNVLFEDYSGGIAEIKAQVEAGNIQWDVVDIEVIDLERACSEGLLEIIPRDILPPGDDGTPAGEDFFEEALANECGVGVIFWTIIYAYNTETIQGGTPSTIQDFFDTETFPGKRAMRKRPQVNLEWALIADGVARDQVYETLATDEGQARAFAKLDTIRDDLVWYESWSQAPQLLNDGGAVLVQSANGRIFKDIQDHDRPLRHGLGQPHLRPRRVVGGEGLAQPGAGDGLCEVRDRHGAAFRHAGRGLRADAALGSSACGFLR